MQDWTDRASEWAERWRWNGFINVVGGVALGLGSRGITSLADPQASLLLRGSEWLWFVGLALVLVGLGILAQSRILWHTARSGLLSAAGDDIPMTSVNRQTGRRTIVAAGATLTLEATLIGGCAWTLLHQGSSALRDGHATMMITLKIFCWNVSVTAGLGLLVGITLMIGITRWRVHD